MATVQKYEQDYMRTVAEGANAAIVGPIATDSGSLEYLEGYGRRINGGFWDENGLNFGPTAGSIAINLEDSLLKDVKYTEGDNGTNTLTLPFPTLISHPCSVQRKTMIPSRSLLQALT